LVLLSPDIDVDGTGQQITGLLSDSELMTVWPEARLPRVLQDRLTIDASPDEPALLVPRILFRRRKRFGQMGTEDIPDRAQRHLETEGRIDLISYEDKRTDALGRSYFTTNPRMSSDLIELTR
jgi:hypothetical protein